VSVISDPAGPAALLAGAAIHRPIVEALVQRVTEAEAQPS